MIVAALLSQNIIHSTDLDGTLSLREYLTTGTDFDCWSISLLN